MKRRQFALGLGTIAAGSAAAVGSGAFTSVEADRTISAEVEQDSDAFLELDALGATERSSAADQVEFEFPSLAEQTEGEGVNEQNPQGLGSDSVYRFESDVEGSDGLLEITNSGTQPVDVFAEQQTTGDVPKVDIFDIDSEDESDGLLTADDPANLEVGDELHVGFQIDTFGVDVASYEIVLTIIADADHETD